MNQLEKLTEFVLWLEKSHNIKVPIIGLVPTAEPLCCRPDMEHIHKQIPGRHVRGMLTKSNGNFTIRVAENSPDLLEIVAHEFHHYLDILNGEDEGIEKGFNPDLEKDVDARAAKSVAEFRIEKRVGPIVERFFETTKGYERSSMFDEWRKREKNLRLFKAYAQTPKPRPNVPTIRSFLQETHQVRKEAGPGTSPTIRVPLEAITAFLEENNFSQRSVSGLPSPESEPAGIQTWEHRDGRTVKLTVELDDMSGAVVVRLQANQAGGHPFNLQTSTDLEEWVLLGKETFASTTDTVKGLRKIPEPVLTLTKSAKRRVPTVTKEELRSAERWDRAMKEARDEMNRNPRVVEKEFADSAFNNPGFKESLQRQCTGCGRTVEGLTRCLCQIGQKGFSLNDYLERKAGEQS